MQWTGLPASTVLALGGLAALFVTALYLLKHRKRRIEVPFSPLWSRVLAERKEHRDWWRRFQRLFSWLLHIVLAGLLAWAMAGPRLSEEVREARHVMILLDNSASMGANDVNGAVNRLEIARRRAQEVLKTVGGEDRVMVVAFSDRLQPLSPFLKDSAVLQGALQRVEVSVAGTDYAQALSFAAHTLRDKPKAELVIISDGAGTWPAGSTEELLGPNVAVRHLMVGERADNVAVTAFNARRYPANALDYELFAEVRSYFGRPVTVDLEIHADGRLVDAKTISLEAGEIHRQFYPSQAVSGERLEARVKLLSADARDVLELDDRAYAVLAPQRPLRVQLVSEGNLYLEGPLLLNPKVELTRTLPASYVGTQEHDVTFFDGFVPEEPAAGHAVYIAPTGSGSPWPVAGETENPIITSVKTSHPLMRWLSLKDLNIARAVRLSRAPGDEVLVSALGQPLIATREQAGFKQVVLAFDVRASDLPLRVAFPVLLFNILDFVSMDQKQYIQSHACGGTISQEWSRDEDVVVTAPDGTPVDSVRDGEQVFFSVSLPGFYRLSSARQTRHVAANLMNLGESAIAPSEAPAPWKLAPSVDDRVIKAPRDLWIWALLAVIALLIVEWWTFQRRITV